MKPTRPLLVLLTITAFTTPALGTFTWQPCTPEGLTTPLLTPTAVTLSPDPPQIGGGVVFGIEGEVAEPVASGTIGLRVKFEGVDLYEEEGPLCDKVAGEGGGCPMQGGGAKALIEYKQDLPPIAPPGHYSVRVIGTTGTSTYEGQAVVCVDVEFDMVVPSAASAVVVEAAGAGVEASAGGGGAGARGDVLAAVV